MRHSGVHLSATARGNRPHADREVHPCTRDPRSLPSHRRALRPLRQRLPVDRGDRARVGRRLVPVDHPHQPRRRDAGQVRGDGHRAAASPQVAGHSGHRHLPGAQLPHQPVGLRLHRRRSVGRTDGAARRPAGRHHRHGGDRRAMRAASVPSVWRAVRVPAHAELDRRAQQRGDRSRVVRHARTGLAAEVARELHDPADRWLRRRRLRDGRLDRHQQADPRQAVRGPQPRVHPRGVPAGVPRQRRREDDPDPRAGRRDHRRSRPPPRHSSRGTASCASGRASTTSTCSRSTTRTRT